MVWQRQGNCASTRPGANDHRGFGRFGALVGVQHCHCACLIDVSCGFVCQFPAADKAFALDDDAKAEPPSRRPAMLVCCRICRKDWSPSTFDPLCPVRLRSDGAWTHGGWHVNARTGSRIWLGSVGRAVCTGRCRQASARTGQKSHSCHPSCRWCGDDEDVCLRRWLICAESAASQLTSMVVPLAPQPSALLCARAVMRWRKTMCVGAQGRGA